MEKYFQDLLDNAYSRIGALQEEVKREKSYKEQAQSERDRYSREKTEQAVKIMDLEKRIKELEEEVKTWEWRYESIFKNWEMLKKMNKGDRSPISISNSYSG